MVEERVEVQISQEHLLIGATGLVLAGLLYAVASGGLAAYSPDTGAASGEVTLRERFDVLRTAGTNSCGAQPRTLEYMVDTQRLQGSCCSPMAFHSYEEQIEGLEAYAEYDIIPPDPYNVSVKWAKRMIEYNDDAELTPEQRAVYREAEDISHEGGPCCCTCWHWYAYAGMGKKLIIEHGFTAGQIADVWDLSDACGGTHAHT